MLPTNKCCTINGPDGVVGRRRCCFVLSHRFQSSSEEGETKKKDWLGWTPRRLRFALRVRSFVIVVGRVWLVGGRDRGRDSYLFHVKEEEKHGAIKNEPPVTMKLIVNELA
jgi:hypothetical protein